MQTTSLEVSRALQEAGFWEGEEATWAYLSIGEGGLTEYANPIKPTAYMFDGSVLAATYDDLVPALGLDKPWDTLNESKAKMLTRLEDAVYCDGFIPNALASVWLDENVKEQPCEECGGVGTLGPFRDADDEYPCPSCGGNVSHPVDSSVRKCVKIQKAQDAPRKGE